MVLKLADLYRRWFEYERDSHAKVMASLSAVPETMHSSPEFRKATTLMAHLAAARELWLFRMGAAPRGPAADEIFPEPMSLAALAGRIDSVEAAWSTFLAPLDDAELERPFEYQSFEGEWYRDTVMDILTQLYGHSLYHRGQIALLMRAIGVEPVVTDFVFWARESIAPPEDVSKA